MKLKINYEDISKYIYKMENEKEVFDFIKEKIDFLYRNNKNYNNYQWVVIQDLKDLFDSIEVEEVQ